jgi:hypothetical protein
VVDSTASRGTSVSLLDMCLLQLNKLYLQRMPQAVQGTSGSTGTVVANACNLQQCLQIAALADPGGSLQASSNQSIPGSG